MSWNLRPGIIIHRKITWLLLFSCFSLLFVSWVIYLNRENLQRSRQRLDRTYETIGMIQQLLLSLPGSPSGSTIYLDSLQQLTGTQEDQQEKITELHSLIAQPRTPDLTNRITASLYAMLSRQKTLLAHQKEENELASNQIGRAHV